LLDQSLVYPHHCVETKSGLRDERLILLTIPAPDDLGAIGQFFHHNIIANPGTLVRCPAQIAP
jgi:hypothetical protein